jgi:dihydrofolate reductase
MATKKLQIKHKPKYTAYIASSIDGIIAKNKSSGTDWTSREDWNFFQKSLSKADAVIAGHNTYKVAKERLDKRNTIVLTSKTKNIKTVGKVTFLNPKVTNLRNFCASKNYKNIAIVGGSSAYSFCLENKILDELFVTVEPYIFGSGVPMFRSSAFKKSKMILESIKKLNKTGTVLLKYKYAN